MERYFLSYVLTGGHSSLALSVQEKEKEDTKIVTEIDFTDFEEDPDPDKHSFLSGSGKVSERGYLSFSLYSRKEVSHRTYEISPTQRDIFLKRVNDDRRKNILVLKKHEDGSKTFFSKGDEEKKIAKAKTDGLVLEAISGPTYNLVRYNCKNYCLDVLKATGVVDAYKLSNYFVQVPGDDHQVLSPVDASVFSCPEKDNAIEGLTSYLQTFRTLASQLNSQQLQLMTLKNDKNITVPAFFGVLNSLLREAEALECIQSKMGVMDEYKKILKQMNKLIKITSPLLDHLAPISDNDQTSEALDMLRKRMKQHLGIWNELYTRIKTVPKKHLNGELQYQWKGVPPTVSQIKVENLSDIERVVLACHQRTKEAIDGCTVIEGALYDSAKNAEMEGDENLKEALNELNTHIVQPTKKELTVGQRTFGSQLNQLCATARDEQKKGMGFNQENHDCGILECCLRQNEQVKTILGSLEEKAKKFMPNIPHKKIGPIKRFIQAVLSLIRKPTFGLTDDPRKLLAKRISKLNRSVLASGPKISPIQKDKVKGGFFSRKRKSTSKNPKNKRPE